MRVRFPASQRRRAPRRCDASSPGTTSLAESLGGVESLVAHPATMTHAAMDDAARCAAGLADGLLRQSVGIESLADPRADLAAGLARVAG